MLPVLRVVPGDVFRSRGAYGYESSGPRGNRTFFGKENFLAFISCFRVVLSAFDPMGWVCYMYEAFYVFGGVFLLSSQTLSLKIMQHARKTERREAACIRVFTTRAIARAYWCVKNIPRT